jgi:hypothetical protein
VGDVDGDGKADRVTIRKDRERPVRCRHVLVVEGGSTQVAPVQPVPWDGALADPRLVLLAEIDGQPGLEPVVELTPAAVYRPGSVFTMREGTLLQMQFDAEAKLPDDLFPFDDEFPAGTDCAGEPGMIVVTFGGLAQRGADDSHYDITRSFYRAAGTRFERLRRERFRVGISLDETRRWPELRGRPFVSCPHRVR